jgi:tetratricopeptide (TPR) repeat protein
VTRHPWLLTAVIFLLLGGVVLLQRVRESLGPLPQPGDASVMYVRSPAAMKRLALGFDGLAADVYWLRAIQHYGGTKLASDPAQKTYARLYPLLDMTTSLDPLFRIAYRFGAIFLSEPMPNGAGRPDLAIALLEKGLRAEPGRWEYAQDIGFVHYWWRGDHARAAEWFLRAADIDGAPNWLKPLAAVTLTQGGRRESSRRLWEEVLANADVGWLERTARQRLRQLDALDRMEALDRILADYERRTGARPRGWRDLVARGDLPGVPVDPEGHPFVLDADRGGVRLNPESPLDPLPAEPGPPGPVRP